MLQSKKGNQSGHKGGYNQVSQTIFICRKYGCNHHQELQPASILAGTSFVKIIPYCNKKVYLGTMDW